MIKILEWTETNRPDLDFYARVLRPIGGTRAVTSITKDPWVQARGGKGLVQHKGWGFSAFEWPDDLVLESLHDTAEESIAAVERFWASVDPEELAAFQVLHFSGRESRAVQSLGFQQGVPVLDLLKFDPDDLQRRILGLGGLGTGTAKKIIDVRRMWFEFFEQFCPPSKPWVSCHGE